ncbi:MAG: ATP-binding protein [Bacteroidia bacterium]
MLFSKVVGHSALKKKLISNALNGRVAHTQLFAGPEGCGALPLAIAYARFLRCENKLPDDGCGTCSSCIKMNKLVHPDVHFTFPAIKEDSKSKGLSTEYIAEFREAFLQNPYMSLENWSDWIDAGNKIPSIYADEANEIIRQIGLVAVEEGFKIFIVWLPELMNVQAANRLLKTLEEPSDKTLILLVSERPHDLLATILSRAQMQKIERYSVDECAQIVAALSNESIEKCRKAAEIAEGNASVARWLVENQDESDEQLNLFRTWMLGCYTYNISELILLTDQFHKLGREWQKGFLTYGLFMVRQTMLKNHQASLNRLTDSEHAFLDKFARFFHPGNYERITGFINDALLHIERNGNGKIVFFDSSLLISDVFRKEKFARASA